MSYSLRYTSEAESCIDEQLRWFEDEADIGAYELADRWLEKLIGALDRLCENPTAQGLAPENGRWHPELEIRQLRFRPWKSKAGWRVLFVVAEIDREVIILQIRHERRPLLG